MPRHPLVAGLMTMGLLLAPRFLFADDSSDAGWSGDLPGPIHNGALQLCSDANTTLSTSGLMTNKPNGSVTINVDPASSSSRKMIELNGPVKLGFYTTLNVTSAHGFTLSLPDVCSNAPGPVVAPTTGNLWIETLMGSIALGGTDSDNRLAQFEGSSLEQKSGHWTLTGDNSSKTWTTSVTSGTLTLASDAALGSGSTSVNGTLAPQAGTSMRGDLNMLDGSTLDLADGTVGPFTVKGKFSGPNGGSVTIHFDVGPTGPDQLILTDLSSTNDIRDYVVLRLLSDNLKPGTYKLVTLAHGHIIENHFGFDFTGDPANHDNIVKTKTLGGYTFTLATIDDSGQATNYTGDYATYTLTIAKTSDHP